MQQFNHVEEAGSWPEAYDNAVKAERRLPHYSNRIIHLDASMEGSFILTVIYQRIEVRIAMAGHSKTTRDDVERWAEVVAIANEVVTEVVNHLHANGCRLKYKRKTIAALTVKDDLSVVTIYPEK